jgi:hypothetical protein
MIKLQGLENIGIFVRVYRVLSGCSTWYVKVLFLGI